MPSRWIGAALVALLAGCVAPRPPVIVSSPTTAEAPAPAAGAAPRRSGGIYTGVGYRPLFEDARPRYVGDVLTITLNEKLNAAQKASSSADRNSEIDAGIKALRGVKGVGISGPRLTADTDNKFEGKGATESSNLFTGTITSTVIRVLPNGNLLVAGEKQIGIRQNSETLKFQGVVDPKNIQPGNTVLSTAIADVRIDYSGGGYIEDAQTQGWLARFFNAWSPL
ncbi:MAG: flagellar basal body L-ring protein FlgH [Burkholderiaceae bacterium]